MALRTRVHKHVASHVAAHQCHGFWASHPGSEDRERLARTVTKTVEYLESLGRTQIEHQHLSHGVVIAPATGNDKPLKVCLYPDSLRTMKRIPFLANGAAPLFQVGRVVRTGLELQLHGSCRNVAKVSADNVAKVSADGPISVYENRKEILEV